MNWTKELVHDVVLKQRSFFKSGVTHDVNWRIAQLKKLRDGLIKNHEKFEEALHADLGRSNAEAYFCDVGSVIAECNETIKGLKKWSKPETHFSGLVSFPSIFTKVYKIPYGCTLIVAPFNFPFLLSLGVLICAIGGGNTAVIKMSSKSVNCTKYLMEFIKETYPEDFVTVIDGGHDVADWCLEERFDKIFYTGSPNVAKHVMSLASNNLTPVALELGGETGNWAIIRKDADIKDAARKIAFAKICNSGQICININQVAVASEIADEFIKELKNQIISQIGENPINNPEYPKLISSGAFRGCKEEAEKYKDRIVFGGQFNESTNQFSTTVIYPVDINEGIVQHELFNPLLPVVKYKDDEINELIKTIEDREHGLALYIFTKDIKWAKKTMSRMQFGSGCINDVIMQILVKGAPFNGVGHSGMGAYHGEWGFREFTHPSTVLIGSTKFNLPLRNHPYTGEEGKKKFNLIKKFLK